MQGKGQCTTFRVNLQSCSGNGVTCARHPNKRLEARWRSILGEPTPHPNVVLDLFVQQNLTSPSPMAYYVGPERSGWIRWQDLLRNATHSPETLQSRRLIFGANDFHPFSTASCPSLRTFENKPQHKTKTSPEVARGVFEIDHPPADGLGIFSELQSLFI